MIKAKQHISNLAAILVSSGISGVVISPGSRNAPLIRAFVSYNVKIYSVIDERSAAYFALGIALQTKIPAVLICTSGTAVLNYAPAVAEAFYQQVPLLVLTADRPPEAIYQNENQTIFQEAVYGKNCKKAFTLHCEPETEDDLHNAIDISSEAYQLCVSGNKGPVHINIPLREPLYDALPVPGELSNLNVKEPGILPHEQLDKELFKNNSTVLFVIGQHEKNTRLQDVVNGLLRRNFVIYAEPISNIQGKGIFTSGGFISDKLPNPDVVIFTGGQVVSKQMNIYLKSLKDTLFIQFSYSERMHQPFNHSCKMIKGEMYQSANILNKLEPDANFNNAWQSELNKWRQKRDLYINEIPFSDITCAQELSKHIQKNAVIFLGNSSAIRYMQMFDLSADEVFANRGTSGIDGSLSTTVGIANGTNKNVFAILGDISFLYDSNGLWNNYLPGNLKIIVFNNGGGEIFKLINDPENIKDILPYQQTRQNIELAKLCAVYGVEYFEVKENKDFSDAFAKFSFEMKNPALMEIKSSSVENALTFKNFIKKLK